MLCVVLCRLAIQSTSGTPVRGGFERCARGCVEGKSIGEQLDRLPVGCSADSRLQVGTAADGEMGALRQFLLRQSGCQPVASEQGGEDGRDAIRVYTTCLSIRVHCPVNRITAVVLLTGDYSTHVRRAFWQFLHTGALRRWMRRRSCQPLCWLRVVLAADVVQTRRHTARMRESTKNMRRRRMMLRYDPYAPIAMAEMRDRWQWAAQARLRRSAQGQRTPTASNPGAIASPGGWLWCLVAIVRGTAPATMRRRTTFWSHGQSRTRAPILRALMCLVLALLACAMIEVLLWR